MTAPLTTTALRSSFELVAHHMVAAILDSPVPAIVLAGDGRTVRLINSAAAHLLEISDASLLIGRPAPLDDAVLKYVQRIAANSEAGKQSSERIRYYRGLKPIMLRLDLADLGSVAGDRAVLVTLPDLARSGVDISLGATLALYGGPDHLVTIFEGDKALAVAGRPDVLDEIQADVEALADRASASEVELHRIRDGHETREVLLVPALGGAASQRLLFIGQRYIEPRQIDPALGPDPAMVLPAVLAQEGSLRSQSGVQTGVVSLMDHGPFAFERRPKPQRFAWEMTADGRFSVVGPDFAATLGPHAAPGPGESWSTVASRLALDADGRFAVAIAARQPWHGLTVMWPVEGLAERVPVDFTAMPIIGPGTGFAGFRGFGLIRTGAGVADPLETGLRLGIKTLPVPVEMLLPAAAVPVVIEGAPDQTDQVDPEAANTVEPAPEPRFPRLVTSKADDHLVSLMPVAHISPETLRLSGAERNAFRQIAEALGARFAGDDDLMASDVLSKSDRPDAPRAGNAITVLSTQDLIEKMNQRGPQPSEGRSEQDGFSPDMPRPPVGDVRLIDRLPFAVGLIRDEAVIHVNSSFLTLTGYSDLDDLNRNGGLDALFAGPHAAKGWAEDRNRHHIPLVTKSGRVLPVDARIASVPWNGGTALLITLISADRGSPLSAGFSSDPAAPELLAQTETRIRELEAILDTVNDGILILEADGRIASANGRAGVLFGVDRLELAGKHVTDLLAPQSRRSATEYLQAVSINSFASRLADGRELTGVRQVGGEIRLFVSLGRIPSGTELTFCAVLRDISEWKRSEEELTAARRRAEEASLQKSDFLAKISHEIRTPLNAIIGFSEVMLGERFGAIGVERYKDYLRDIQSSGTHIMSLVNDLLDLSKVEAGKLELSFESVQLSELLAECVALMQPQANRDRIIIRASLAQGLPPVVADARSIRQIVLNLLSNAIKFTPAGGQVIVSAAEEETREVVIRIRDTGYGMSQTDIEIALEPFRQVPNGRGKGTAPGAGTGLGLPLTKALVEANRASFRIDSAVNQGTLVQVTFPPPKVLAAE